MSQILLISPEKIEKRMAGVGIRYWEFANALSKDNNVTLAVPNKDFPLSNKFNIIKYNLMDFRGLMKGIDVVILQGHISNYFFNQVKNIPTVIDLYDPYILENLNYTDILGNAPYFNDYETLTTQLNNGDFFLCSNEKQRDFYIGMLCALGRINPITYNEDRTLANLISCVPFGVPDHLPLHSKKVLRNVIKGIKEDDFIIFFGGIYEWYDPVTLIHSIKDVCEKKENVRLIFSSNPNPGTPQKKYELAKELSKKLNLENKNIFFINWFEYEERENFYLESDIAISTHALNLETSYSFRTRILDYLWSGLPIISTRGGSVSELLERYDAGILVDPGDVDQLTSAILLLINDKEKKERLSRNGKVLADKFRWDIVVEPLKKFCANPGISSDKRQNFFNIKKNSHGIKRLISLITNKYIRI